jgi:hypothetical protein
VVVVEFTRDCIARSIGVGMLAVILQVGLLLLTNLFSVGPNEMSDVVCRAW